jgi:periplasmic divalent cation tolerance protein
MDFLQVQTAVAAEADAERIARAVLEARAAACVQVVGPVTSRYWWQGEIQTEVEYLLLCKTHTEAVERLLELIRAAHPYEVPELIATPIVNGSADYLRWIAAEVR